LSTASNIYLCWTLVLVHDSKHPSFDRVNGCFTNRGVTTSESPWAATLDLDFGSGTAVSLRVQGKDTSTPKEDTMHVPRHSYCHCYAEMLRCACKARQLSVLGVLHSDSCSCFLERQ